MKTIHIYTDGACSGNPGPGGWAFTAIVPRGKEGSSQVYQQYGGLRDTTNQQMELEGCVQGLQFVSSLSGAFDVRIFTDSAYLANCFNDKWYVKWRRNGWKNAKGESVKNQEQWKEILRLLETENMKEFSFHKVAGHSGNKWNEETDKLAKQGILQL